MEARSTEQPIVEAACPEADRNVDERRFRAPAGVPARTARHRLILGYRPGPPATSSAASVLVEQRPHALLALP
jgi:hypothetical protein